MLGETQPYDRHTQGTYWYMRLDTLAQGHARARTRSRTHGVEAALMRLLAGTLSPHRPGTFT